MNKQQMERGIFASIDDEVRKFVSRYGEAMAIEEDKRWMALSTRGTLIARTIMSKGEDEIKIDNMNHELIFDA